MVVLVGGRGAAARGATCSSSSRLTVFVGGIVGYVDGGRKDPHPTRVGRSTERVPTTATGICGVWAAGQGKEGPRTVVLVVNPTSTQLARTRDGRSTRPRREPTAWKKRASHSLIAQPHPAAVNPRVSARRVQPLLRGSKESRMDFDFSADAVSQPSPPAATDSVPPSTAAASDGDDPFGFFSAPAAPAASVPAPAVSDYFDAFSDLATPFTAVSTDSFAPVAVTPSAATVDLDFGFGDFTAPPVAVAAPAANAGLDFFGDGVPAESVPQATIAALDSTDGASLEVLAIPSASQNTLRLAAPHI